MVYLLIFAFIQIAYGGWFNPFSPFSPSPSVDACKGDNPPTKCIMDAIQSLNVKLTDKIDILTAYIKPSFAELEGAALNWSACSYHLVEDESLEKSYKFIVTALHCAVKQQNENEWILQIGWEIPKQLTSNLNDIYVNVEDDVILFELTSFEWLDGGILQWHNNEEYKPLSLNTVNTVSDKCKWSHVMKMICFCGYKRKYNTFINDHSDIGNNHLLISNEEFIGGDSGCLCQDIDKNRNCLAIAIETHVSSPFGFTNSEIKNIVNTATNCKNESCDESNALFSNKIALVAQSRTYRTYLSSLLPLNKYDIIKRGVWNVDATSEQIKYGNKYFKVKSIKLTDNINDKIKHRRTYFRHHSISTTSIPDDIPPTPLIVNDNQD